jgi:putative hydrolase of the HAD superfamily
MKVEDYQNIKMMTFDVVGTLINFEQGIINYFKEIECKYADENILSAFGEAEGIQQQETPEMPFTQMLVPIYDRITEQLQIPDGKGDEFRRSIEKWPAFSDSVEALKRLKQRFRLVALTNADNWALSHMSNTLENPFSDTVTCEDVGVNKPDAQVFAYCRGRQSVHDIGLNATMHVAQSQYHDIGISMRLGYKTCWIERREGQAGFGATPNPETITQPDLNFGTLRELADHIEVQLSKNP